jgi:hypothetical protein
VLINIALVLGWVMVKTVYSCPLYMRLKFENHWCGSFLYFSELMGSGLDASRCDSLNLPFECTYYCLIRDLVAIE